MKYRQAKRVFRNVILKERGSNYSADQFIRAFRKLHQVHGRSKICDRGTMLTLLAMFSS